MQADEGRLELNAGGDEFETNYVELSHRERQLLTEAMRGHTDKEIALNLGISIATVKSYWLRVRRKVGGHSRTQAVANAMLQENTCQKAAHCGAGGFEKCFAACSLVPFTILVVDYHGIILGATKPLLGSEQDQLLGKCLLEFGDDASRHRLILAMDAVRNTGKQETVSTVLRDSSGRAHLFIATIHPPVEGAEFFGLVLCTASHPALC